MVLPERNRESNYIQKTIEKEECLRHKITKEPHDTSVYTTKLEVAGNHEQDTEKLGVVGDHG